MQAVFALTLQAATMADQAVKDAEDRPSTARLQSDLEAALKKNPEFADRLVAMVKSSIEAAKKASQDAEQAWAAADRLQVEVIEARRSSEVALKEVVEQKEAEDQREAVAEGKAERAAEELAAKVVELEGAKVELAGLKEKVEPIELNPCKNVEYFNEFAYYLES
ncbi:hypothetical protein OROHE_000129 [Orobanche hederae]